MADILHRIGIEHTTPGAVYERLTTLDGLSSWWTDDTRGDPGAGGTIEFRFLPGSIFMSVGELVPDQRVVWSPVTEPEEWVGTTVTWDLRQDGDFTIVLFEHTGWAEPTEFMHHCSTKWATFLMSLKQAVETGVGAPAPHDVKISDWH